MDKVAGVMLNHCLSKQLKFAVIVWTICSIECLWVEGSPRCPMWFFLLWCGGDVHNCLQDYKTPTTRWIVLRKIIGRDCGNVWV